MRVTAAGTLLLLSLGCAPVVRLPAPEARIAPAAAPASAPATNPGKVVLVVVGAFCALLVLMLIVEGRDLSN